MPLWDKSGTKPVHLSSLEKRDCIATPDGWVLRKSYVDTHSRSRKKDIILVAIGNLSEVSTMGQPSVSEMYVANSSGGSTIRNGLLGCLNIVYDEPITFPTGEGKLLVTIANTASGNNLIGVSNNNNASITNANNTLVFKFVPGATGTYKINTQSFGNTATWETLAGTLVANTGVIVTGVGTAFSTANNFAAGETIHAIGAVDQTLVVHSVTNTTQLLTVGQPTATIVANTYLRLAGGTIATAGGSNTVTGTLTDFAEDFSAGLTLHLIGTAGEFVIHSVTNSTQIIATSQPAAAVANTYGELLAGTFSANTGSVVTGTGTAFSTNFATTGTASIVKFVGSDEVFTIREISSATVMFVTTAPTANVVANTYQVKEGYNVYSLNTGGEVANLDISSAVSNALSTFAVV